MGSGARAAPDDRSSSNARQIVEPPSLPPPVAVNYALAAPPPESAPFNSDDHEPSRPSTPARSASSRDHTSPRKPTHHYKHHEPAPRRLLKRLNSLLHGPKHHRKYSHPSSAASSRSVSVLSSLRPSLVHTPLPAEPATFEPAAPTAEDARPSVKIRLVTFNMHDSLPASSGDLSEFLGDVSQFPDEHMPRRRRGGSRSSKGSTLTVPLPDEEGLPSFPLTEGHPYHVVVVCGQECPKASGVLAGKVQRLYGKGWTSLLEAYLCGGCSHSSPTSSSASSEGGSDVEDGGDGVAPAAEARPPSRGPYVLIEKERLMGIYCAVFVAKCCEGLVKGVSTGRVTAGLMGGRMGNKGGVGVSLYLHNTRLLFISAHLAAHASGLEFRKANAIKILNEIAVDDFWVASGQEGPRPPKLADRFDAVFFAGDLNFRLNISRLHADWLVRGKDYATALRFDQLRDVLASPAGAGCFDGFAEGDIAFPPTYKYDVPTRKRRRGTLLRLAAGKAGDQARGEGAAGVEAGAATDPEVPLTSTPATPRPGSGTGWGGSSAMTATDDDTMSVISSVGTIDTLDCAALDAPPNTAAAREDLASLGLQTAPAKGGETGVDTVRKAQVRFLTLVKRNSDAAALEYARRAREANEGAAGSGTGTSARARKGTLSGLFPQRPILHSSQSAIVVPTARLPSEAGAVADGAESPEVQVTDEAVGPAAEPVFDTSKKQRVQSWTDRILFHSSAPPPGPTMLLPDSSGVPQLDRPAGANNRASRPPRSVSADEVRPSRFDSPSPLGDTLLRSSSSRSLAEPSSLWRRVKSSVFDALDAPATPSTPPPPRRPKPRHRFTLSGDSSSSDGETPPRRASIDAVARPVLPHSASDSPAPRAPSTSAGGAGGTAGFPRARTVSAALNKLHDRAAETVAGQDPDRGRLGGAGPAWSASGTSLNTRLRSFLSLLPLPPFLSMPARAASPPAEEDEGAAPRQPRTRIGPRRGEVQVVRYDCVRDLARMGAVSDHRPVFLVCALGIGGSDSEGGERGGFEE
ncbi:hypothetical protein JCM3770_005200 [Rhodotorula araucariae]